jgi:hypothetical protein
MADQALTTRKARIEASFFLSIFIIITKLQGSCAREYPDIRDARRKAGVPRFGCGTQV